MLFFLLALLAIPFLIDVEGTDIVNLFLVGGVIFTFLTGLWIISFFLILCIMFNANESPDAGDILLKKKDTGNRR